MNYGRKVDMKEKKKRKKREREKRRKWLKKGIARYAWRSVQNKNEREALKKRKEKGDR